MRKKHIKFSAIVISLIVLFIGVYYLFIKNRHRLSSDKNLNVILISIDAARADRFSFHGFSSNWRQPFPDWKPGEEGLGKALAKYILAYEAELFRIDKQIGLLMKNLRRRNVGDNTLVIIITDHGEEFAEHTF
jgi:membrane-anchored protein YejM (alkaline phosphatase superfamily)